MKKYVCEFCAPMGGCVAEGKCVAFGYEKPKPAPVVEPKPEPEPKTKKDKNSA